MERVTGWKPEGKAAGGFIHLINSGAAALDATGASTDENGNHVMKKWYDMTDADVIWSPEGHRLVPCRPWIFPRRRILLSL